VTERQREAQEERRNGWGLRGGRSHRWRNEEIEVGVGGRERKRGDREKGREDSETETDTEAERTGRERKAE
jgi:hypothetical protein